jgi:glycosyltransferase involved in cell wall biosynthesis
VSSHPLVSIVSPSFNQTSFVQGNLDSVTNQTYGNIEHIVIDGGSSDGTVDILRNHSLNNELNWVSEPDSGMYEAINKGLNKAQGEILAYLNTDDRYFSWTVSTVVKFFEKRPDVDVVFGDLWNVDVETKRGELYLYPPFRNEYFFRSGFLGQPTVFWRRSVQEKLGNFDQSLQLVADCDYWMRAAKQFKVGKINEVLAIEQDHLDAKRFAQATSLQQEIHLVRTRHTKSGTTAPILKIFDRVYPYIWRRIFLLQLGFTVLTHRWLRKMFRDQGRWSNFVSHTNLRMNWLKLAATFLPFTGGRFARGMISISGKK